MAAFWIAVFVAFAIGGLVFTYFSPSARARRLLARTRISRIRDFPEHSVGRVVGKVVEVVGGPLVSPASGKACAYYSFAIRERQSSGKSSSWVTLFSASESRDFWVEDGSGRALVHAMVGASWVVVKDVHGRSGTFDDPTPAERDLFMRHGVNPEGFLGMNRVLEFHEATIALDEFVTVLGVGRREIDTTVAGQGYREPGKRLVISQEGEIMVVVSDENENLV